MSKLCIECSNAVKGRSDKKFCSLFCKSAFHNRKQAEKNNFIRKTNAILRRNRRILRDGLAEGYCNLSRQDLLASGFCFKHITMQQQSEGVCYFYCYEFAYSTLDFETYNLYLPHEGFFKDKKKTKQRTVRYVPSI